MNYGNGGNAALSGEKQLLNSIRLFYKGTNALVIFDAGANVGNYSRSIDNIFGQQCRIHAFEPSLPTYRMLATNTKDIKTMVLNNCGLAEHSSTQTLYLNKEGSTWASLYQRDLQYLNVYMDKQEKVVLTTIDAYCRQHVINHIHFLKLDIEGHELSALKGAAYMMESNAIDFIQFEFGGCNIDSRTFFKDFYNLLHKKYSLYRILRNGLEEIVEYRETWEIFTAVNFIARRRTLAELVH